jgi:hypothetical protein
MVVFQHPELQTHFTPFLNFASPRLKPVAVVLFLRRSSRKLALRLGENVVT